MRIAICVAAAIAAAGAGCAFAQVGDALQRPALSVKAPQRAVLLAAATAGQRLVAVGERGVVVLSDDRGATWRQAACPVSVSLTMVRFADERHGVAVGHGGTVLTTADAGASWVLRLDGRRLAILAKAAATTPQAQQDAERLVADGPDKPFMDVVVWDAQRMLAVGAYGLAFYTADGGQTWAPWMGRLPNPKALHWYVARRQGTTLLLAGEQGLLARSSDGGATFEALPSPYKGSWFAGELQANGHAVLAGLRGNAWRTGDAGNTWSQLVSPTQSTITAVADDGKGGLWFATQAGAVLRQQGDALVPLNAAPVPMPSALLPQREGSLLALGVAGVVPVVTQGAQP
jgi:photosystem II stability/assembly factor-like uncharacterized protein